MVIICRCSVGLIFGQSARTEIAYIFLNIKAIVRVLSKEIAILILMYKKNPLMLPDCVGVWYPSCSSWVKSESLNRRYLSFCFLTIFALIRRNKKQKEI